jgi:protocatechuate 3,4-dioxygenase beta subunit
VLPGPVMSGIVKAPGYTSVSATSWTGNAWPDVTLDAPAQVEVVLARGGRIEGVVRTPEGQPIAAATVVAAAGGMMAMMSLFGGSPSGETDAEGRYRIDGVAPGEYHLAAVAPGFAPAEAGDASTKAAVPEQGGTVALDLVLAPACVISGVVLDGQGEPVPGARVRTRPSLGNLMGGGRGGAGGGGGLPANTGARMIAALRTSADLTDPEGRFRLEGVSPGVDWTVEAEAEDFVPVQSERLRLKAGEAKELKLLLVGGATLSGYVTGEGGSRVAGARIRVGTLEPEEAARPFLSAWQADRMLDARVFVSDDEGRFLIPNVKPGRVAVKAEHPDWVTSFKRNLSLAPDEVRENHAILLARGEVAEGVVRGADGRPLEGVVVVVTSQRNPGPGSTDAGTAEGGGEGVEPAMNARTDRDGKFKVENIPPGTWSVVVGFAPGHAGWFGTQDESAIVRDVSVPAHGVEFRLKAQEMPAFPMGGPPRPVPVAPPAPRPPGAGGGGGSGGSR